MKKRNLKLMLLAVLASVTILPACGKNDSGNSGINTGAAVLGAAGGTTYAFSGTTQAAGYSGLNAQASVTGAGSQSGLPYVRVDGSGDVMEFTISGSAIAGWLFVSPTTAAYLGCGTGYTCNVTITGIEIINATVVNTYGYGSNVNGSFYIMTSLGAVQM